MKSLYNRYMASWAVIALLIFTSCDEEGDSVGVSTTTYFPAFDIIDGESVVIATGDDFTPNAVVTEGENELTPDVDNGVDNANPGVYTVTYSAENSDGYAGRAVQEVIVYDPSIIPTDVVGNIADIGRPERKGVITLVEGTTNIFHCTDMGFAGTFPLYFQMNGDVMEVIPQAFALSVTSVEASYDPVSRQYSITVQPYGFEYNFQYE